MLPVNPTYYKNTQIDKLIQKRDKNQIRTLEEASGLSIVEKINLLAILLGHKWITDVAIDEKDKTGADVLLEQLGLPYQENHYEYEDERHTWLQVAANKAILQYVLERGEDLSVLEAGVLYGYPVSHSLSYIGVLEKEMKGNDKTIAEFYLSGVFSRTYSEQETAHFELIWKDIVQQSHVIKREAELYYRQRNIEA